MCIVERSQLVLNMPFVQSYAQFTCEMKSFYLLGEQRLKAFAALCLLKEIQWTKFNPLKQRNRLAKKALRKNRIAGTRSRKMKGNRSVFAVIYSGRHGCYLSIAY